MRIRDVAHMGHVPKIFSIANNEGRLILVNASVDGRD